MIARPEECDSARLARMLDDALSVKEQMDVTEHLDHCQQCRSQLEQLAAEESWWTDTQQALRDVDDTQGCSGSSTACDATAAIFLGGESLAGSNSLSPGLGVSPASEGPTLPSSTVTGDEQNRDGGVPDEHWVLSLLSPSEDPHVLGNVDAMPIHSVVGQGGMGVVLKARDTSLHRFLAVKLLSPMLACSGAARERFMREAQAAAAVVHPNIVPIYAVSAQRKIPYLVMPFVAGGNLQQILDESGAMPLERTLSIGLQVAEGLAAAHRQGIVHRDIKPANLMFDEGGFRVMLTDFGLARALDDASLTASGMVAGTPQFMSPEQARGHSVDQRSDIYSLGAVLYALATGRPPVRGDSTLDVLRRIVEDEPISILELNACYPSWFQRLVDLLMAKDIGDRPQSADEVSELMRACLAHARRPQRASLPPQLQAKRTWLPMIAVLVLCAASFLVGGFAWSQNLLGTLVSTEQSPNAAEKLGIGRGADPPLGLEQQAETPIQSPPVGQPLPIGDYKLRFDRWDTSEIEFNLSLAEHELQLLQQELQWLESNALPLDAIPTER